ncbi:uncharacterized protein H6S33_003165 [Morchella sextelata]|uniref:uncharacterized protein n=1 Tax=Morchella sextelata TaxID=1174677 RepID=UPI001D051DF2|nr:uncharacterized protein H6S33_003165 [Morchella sextelata]KAH0607177.1 hypothetical protein H6S33_003165 [Morchella sextelata]
MGNLCGKETSTSTAPPGRVLGSAPATLSSTNAHTPAAASRPKNPRKPKVTGPGRTLGDASVNSEQSSGSAASPPPDARTAAALAAEKRLNDAQKGGKLGAQLDQVKRKTQNQHIQDLAKSKGEQERLVWD